MAGLAQDLIGEHAFVEPAGAGGRGNRGPRGPEKWMDQIMGSLGNSIAGGASNIKRNIIVERGLGLPRHLAMSGERCAAIPPRLEERRVGTERVSPCRSRGTPSL